MGEFSHPDYLTLALFWENFPIEYILDENEEEIMNKTQGIYKITNLINGKCYIGKSEDIEYRKKVHFRELNEGIHHSAYLQEDFKKYGKDNFSFEIIEIINDKELLMFAERFFIDKFDSFKSGYNMTYPRLFKHDNPIFTKYQTNNSQNFISELDTFREYISIEDDLLADFESGLAPKPLYDSSELLLIFINYCKEHFSNLTCNIRYVNSKSKPKQKVAIEMKYFDDFTVLYFLNKDIKLANHGACGDAINNPTEIQDKIWGKRLIDIKKTAKFWE